jgi:hypothetical protein
MKGMSKRRRSIITKKDGKLIVDPKQSVQNQVKKLAKPRKKKVWRTFQVSEELNNEATKASIMLNINVSKYLRNKLVELIQAAKLGRIPKLEDEFIEIPKATVDTSLEKQT